MDRTAQPQNTPVEPRLNLSWLGSPKARNHIVDHYLECPEPKLRKLLQEWLRMGRSDYPQHAWPFVAGRNPPPYRFALISLDGRRLFYLPWTDSEPDLELKASENNHWVTFPEVIRLNGSLNRRELWRLLQPVHPFLATVAEKFAAPPDTEVTVNVPPDGDSTQGGKGLETLIASYRAVGEMRDGGRFTLPDNYRQRFLAMKCSRSPFQTILDRWRDLLQQLGDAATVELAGGGFRPARLIFRPPEAIQDHSIPPGGELFDLLIRPHREADPVALTLAALIKALFEDGAKEISWRCREQETLFRPDGNSTSRPIRSERPELSVTGLSWNKAGELESALRQIYPSSTCPWDPDEPAVYLQGEFGLEQGPWPKMTRITTLPLDRPFSLLVYLHNATGHFPNGSIRFLWPGGQYRAAQPGTLPADVLVLSSSPPQRDPSLQRLSDPNLLEDVKTLAGPYIAELLASLNRRPLAERIHYIAASLRLQDLTVSRYGAYWRTLMELRVFRTLTGREVSIREACEALRDLGFFGEVEQTETVCKSINQEYLFRKGDFPNLFSQQFGDALSRVDGTKSAFLSLQDLISAAVTQGDL